MWPWRWSSSVSGMCVCGRRSQEVAMARIEYIKLRLNNWALWKAREQGGGLGFASQSSFLNDYDSDRYRESRIPVDDVDASQTDAAVEALKPDRAHLWQTLQCIYPLA